MVRGGMENCAEGPRRRPQGRTIKKEGKKALSRRSERKIREWFGLSIDGRQEVNGEGKGGEKEAYLQERIDRREQKHGNWTLPRLWEKMVVAIKRNYFMERSWQKKAALGNLKDVKGNSTEVWKAGAILDQEKGRKMGA